MVSHCGYNCAGLAGVAVKGREVLVWAAVIFALVSLYPSVRRGCGAPEIRPGVVAPPFQATAASGTEVWSSETWRGRAYGLLFFATWCSSCLSEMPEVARILREGRSSSVGPIRLLAVSDEPRERVAAYLASSGLELPVAAGAGEMFASFGVRAVPTMVVVQDSGVVAFARAGSGAVFEGIRLLKEMETSRSRGPGERGHSRRPRRRSPRVLGNKPTTTGTKADRQASGGLMGCLRVQEGGKHVNRMSCRDTPSNDDNARRAGSIPPDPTRHFV